MILRDRFYLVHKNMKDDLIYNTYKKLTNQVSYKDNLIDSQDGVLIPLPDYVIYGELIFELYAPNELGGYANYRTDGSGGKYNTYVRYCHIKDLKCIYTNTKYYVDIFSREAYDPDLLYSNIIDGDYVTELDDITLKVNSYSDRSSSYSYVLYLKGATYDFLGKVYDKTTNKSVLLEELLVEKYVNHYSTPKFQYTNKINNKNITPYTIIYEDTLNRNLIVNSLSYDMVNDSVEINTIEL